MEVVTDFIFLDSKITTDGDCSHEIKRRMLLGRKAMTNLNSWIKSRDITLPTKVCIVKAMFFLVIMYRCKSWTIKKAESRNWCFWIVVLEKTLESPLDCKEVKPSVLKEINSDYSLEGRMLKLKLQYFGLLMSRLTGKDTDAGKDWRQQEKRAAEDEMVRQHHRLNEHEFEQTPGDSGGKGSLACCSSWGHKELDVS